MHNLFLQSLLRKYLTDTKKAISIKAKRLFSFKSKEGNLTQYLKQRIISCGPITIAEYMKEALTNPNMGYYMNKDVFGTKGDFITSPEISQMFGELVAVWCINEYQRLNIPGPFQIVELGPGRGTLASDLLRVISRIEGMRENVSLHLVEVSPKLRELQEKMLKTENNSSSNQGKMSLYKIPVWWYTSLNEVPKTTSIFIAHEFFDALPFHKLQKTKEGWREVLLDVDNKSDSSNHFCYVLSKTVTPVSQLFSSIDDKRQALEVSPISGIIIQEIASRIEKHGGCALIADYGHNGTKEDTFRGFKEHKVVDPLSEPGTADITADVDFFYLKQMAGNKILTFGPLQQRKFLENMAIYLRLQVLLKNAPKDQHAAIVSGYNMLVDSDKMGERFQFLILMPKSYGQKYPNELPSGFSNPYIL